MELRLLTAFAVVILAFALPLFGALICGMIVAVQLALMALRPSISMLPSQFSSTAPNSAATWFSIHVATHSEPPELVIATVRALLDQDWSEDEYEIVVLDNNTADPALWKPVARFCAAHPDRVRFLHRMSVKGAKAGALNIALDETDPRATHIITVDADYVVTRDFLRRAAAALHRTGADYVQFPQSYSGTAIAAAGIDAELEEYFRTHATRADDAEAVLLTGTLCVISRTALVTVGGWSGATTTEDAELGVRLCDAGFSGRFINEVVGKGLLPLSLRDLEKQRYRWCSGNAQTLVRHARVIFTAAGSLTLAKRLVILSQLTAWFNLALVPFLLLLGWLLTGQDHTLAASLAGCAIVLSLCDIVIRVLARGWRDGLPLRIVLHALACRIALAPQSAKATVDAMTGSGLSFIVTRKTICDGRLAPELHLCALLICILGLLLLVTVEPTEPMVVAALGVLMLSLPAAMLTDRSLRTYRETVMSPTGSALV